MNADDAVVFDREIGSRLSEELQTATTSIYSPYRLHLDYVMRQFRESGAYPKIPSVALVDECSFNAVAFTDGTRELIGINAGVAIVLPLFFYDLFGRRDVFPEMGNASVELAGNGHIDPNLFNATGPTAECRIGDNWRPVLHVPQDPVRSKLATLFAMIAWDFILFHEMTHILRCHIPFMERMLSLPRRPERLHKLFEFPDDLASEELKLSRVLECDADFGAARTQVSGWLQNDLRAVSSMFGATIRSWSEFCYFWQLSIQLLFQVMAMVDAKNVGDGERSHPHPDVRAYMLMNFISPMWRKVIPSDAEYAGIAKRAKNEIDHLLERHVLWGSKARMAESYREEFKSEAKALGDGILACNQELFDLGNKRKAQKDV